MSYNFSLFIYLFFDNHVHDPAAQPKPLKSTVPPKHSERSNMCFSIAANAQKKMTSPALVVAMPTPLVTRDLINDLFCFFLLFFSHMDTTLKKTSLVVLMHN